MPITPCCSVDDTPSPSSTFNLIRHYSMSTSTLPKPRYVSSKSDASIQPYNAPYAVHCYKKPRCLNGKVNKNAILWLDNHVHWHPLRAPGRTVPGGRIPTSSPSISPRTTPGSPSQKKKPAPNHRCYHAYG